MGSFEEIVEQATNPAKISITIVSIKIMKTLLCMFSTVLMNTDNDNQLQVCDIMIKL
jgi:hypothetical protein